MGRWQCSLAGLLGLLALCSGCAANRPANPFARQSGSSTTAQKAKKKSAADQAVADRKNTSGSDSTAAVDSQRSGAAASGAAAQGGANNGGHDPQTMAYIDQELRDATPEERAKQMTLLQGMDPEMVRQILHSRRLAMRAVEQKQFAGPGPDSYSQGAIQRVGAESPAIGGGAIRRVNSGEGLGSLPAWPQQAGNGSLSPPTIVAGGGTDNPNVAQDGGLAPQGTGQAPVGHRSGFHGDIDYDAAGGPGYATTRPGSAPAGRVAAATGQLGPGQYGVVQPGGGMSGGAQRATGAKPPIVAVGVPMSASAAPPGTTGAVVGANLTTEGGARDQLVRYISSVESEAFELQPGETDSERQAYIEKQVHLRMLYLMSGQQERALQAIPGLDPADQEFWQQTFWGLANYFDVNSIPSSADRAAQTVTQLTNAVLRLQEKARLELRNVTFCHKISSFGNYEKYPRDEFSPGQEVLLYAEVANTHSEPIPDGKFKTSLKSTLEIYRHGTQGDLIERIDLPETVDVCRTHRRDYFHSYQFTIPAKLALGPHVLKLSVEDQLSHRVGTYTLNFMVK